MGFQFEEIIAWRFCEFQKTKFYQLPIFSIELDTNRSERDSLKKNLKQLPQDLFQIRRVEHHTISQIEEEDEDNIKEGSLAYYLQNWESYMNLAIMPEPASGPDIFILFKTTIIFVSITLRKPKVEKDKLVKNSEKSNPLYFYHTEKGEKINKGYKNYVKSCRDSITSRYSEGKLKSIIRIHISIPERSTTNSCNLPKDCISYQSFKIGIYEIPSIVIDISGTNIEKSGILSEDIIKQLLKKY